MKTNDSVTPRQSIPRTHLFAFAVLMLWPVGGLVAAQQQQARYSWPGDSWPRSTPAAEQIDPEAITALVDDIEAGRYGLIDHFLLVRHGRIVVDRHWDHAERYQAIARMAQDTVNHQYNYDHPDWHPLYRDGHLHSLQSVTKSVMSIGLGIAVDEGYIPNVNTPVWPYVHAYGPDLMDSRRHAATVEDFLTMRSGIAWATPGATYSDTTHPTVVLEKSAEWIQYVVDRPMTTQPGTQWDYNDGVSVLLGKVVRTATGQPFDRWVEEKLFAPIGIQDYYWKITPDGEADTEGGLYLSPHDLARIGYLMLRHGQWNGQQIVSEEWVRKSVSPVVPDINPFNQRVDPGYGYQWWVPLHRNGNTIIFAANGYGGQFLHVAPEDDLVVVFNGWTLHTSPELSSWRALEDRILPAIRQSR